MWELNVANQLPVSHLPHKKSNRRRSTFKPQNNSEWNHHSQLYRFPVLKNHNGFTLNLAVKSARRSTHSCYAFILCISPLKKPCSIIYLNNRWAADKTLLKQQRGLSHQSIHVTHIVHTQIITGYSIRLLNLVS